MRIDDDNELTEAVIGAAIEVHRELGAGFLESTYQKAMAIELRLRELNFQLEVPVELFYKGESIGDGKIDILVEGRLVVELKAVTQLVDAHKSQVITYLKASGERLGLLVNFHEDRVVDGIKRIAN